MQSANGDFLDFKGAKGGKTVEPALSAAKVLRR